MTFHYFSLAKETLVLTEQEARRIPEAVCTRLKRKAFYFRSPSRKLVTALLLTFLISTYLFLHIKKVFLTQSCRPALGNFFVTTMHTLISYQ